MSQNIDDFICIQEVKMAAMKERIESKMEVVEAKKGEIRQGIDGLRLIVATTIPLMSALVLYALSQIIALKTDFVSLKTDVDQRMTALDTRLGAIENDMGSISASLIALQKSIDSKNK